MMMMILWKGWLRLASADPSAPPLLQPNYLATEQDRCGHSYDCGDDEDDDSDDDNNVDDASDDD